MHLCRKLVSSATAVLTGPAPPSKPEAPPIPLEILPLGEFEPEYRLPLDVQVQRQYTCTTVHAVHAVHMQYMTFEGWIMSGIMYAHGLQHLSRF
jgi:hypothetical protein